MVSLEFRRHIPLNKTEYCWVTRQANVQSHPQVYSGVLAGCLGIQAASVPEIFIKPAGSEALLPRMANMPTTRGAGATPAPPSFRLSANHLL